MVPSEPKIQTKKIQKTIPSIVKEPSIVITKKMIKVKYIYTVEGYVRTVRNKIMKLIYQDAIDLIIFFYAKPINMNVKYQSKIKVILIEPLDNDWNTLQNKIWKVFGPFSSGKHLLRLNYKNGEVYQDIWSSCRWDESDIFKAHIDVSIASYKNLWEGIEEGETEKINQINFGLCRYYRSLGTTYNNNFLSYCEENGFADDSLADEFEEEPHDCMLAQFDSNFPFKLTINDNKQKCAKIVEIIKNCFNNADAYLSGNNVPTGPSNNSIPEIDGKFFTLNKSDRKESEETLKQQANVIYNNGMKTEKSILNMIAIGHKNDIPYIHFLADMYSRDIVEGIIEHRHPVQWLEQHQVYTTLKSIKTDNENIKPAELTIHGITYFHRICPRLILPPTYYISDSLQIVAQFISQTIKFTNNLATSGTYFPFQIDHCTTIQNNNNNGEDDRDDDDDDDDEQDDEKKLEDVIGNISKKLNSSKLKNIKIKIKLNDRTGIIYNNGFKELSKQVGGSFPKNSRFCTLIDRRETDKDTSNPLYMWIPPEDCKLIPNKYVPEWFFNASTATILPHEKYNNGKDQKNKQNINAQNINGALLVLSFHVYAVDEIKCYLYVNGQMSRFMPKDIVGLLPKLFDMEYKGNKQFVKSKDAQQLIESLDIHDVRFEKFRKYVSKNK